jgi:phage gp29-like protein
MAMTIQTPPDVFDIEYAYKAPSDPLDKPADPAVIYRDIPAAYSQGWDPSTMQGVLQAHLNGTFLGSALLWDSLLGDPRVQATLLARTQALFGRAARFKAGKGPKADECLAAWKERWPLIGKLSTLSEILRWQIGMGFQHSEIVWDTSGEIWTPYLKPWNAQFEWYHLISRTYIATTYDGLLPVTPGDGKWFESSPHGSYRAWLHGVVRSIAIPWLTRQYAIRDFARFCEIHGIPILKAFVPAMGDAQQKQRYQNSLRNMGSESVVMCPVNVDGSKYDLELVEAKDTSWQAFSSMLNACDASIILPILGENLTTEIKDGGSYAAVKGHGDVKQSVLEGDNTTMGRDIYECVARPFAFYNFGDPDAAPYTDFDVGAIADVTKFAQALQAYAVACSDLARGGVEFDPGALAAAMNLPGIPNQPTPTFAGRGSSGGGFGGQ